MSANSHCFVEWKEEFVSQERGNRVVHYFLKDSAGESIRAVVGTERSLRHMFYVVAEEFLQVCGAENSINAGFKWRSRREVVDWLTSMLSKQYLPTDRFKSPKNDSMLASTKFPSGPGGRRTHIPDYKGRVARNLKGHSSDIMWSGAGWACGKQLKHYPSFCRNETSIAIQSFVFIMAKEEDHYLAHLEDMYEDRKGQKKVKVRWFHQNQEVKGVVPLRNLHPKEVFITHYVQVVSAECVDGPAIVLTPEHYEKYSSSFPPAMSGKVHFCSRQFRSNRLKPFDLSKVRGYFDQAIFSCLDSNLFLKPNSTCRNLAEEEDEDYSPGDTIKKGAKRARVSKGRQKFLTGRSGTRISGQGRQLLTCEPPYKNLRYSLSGERTRDEPLQRNNPLFMVDEKIEVLCLDSGIRGCWFRCTVLQVSRKQIKVQYNDLQDEDGCGKLEEWIPAVRRAVPDKLGMRCSGRPTIRPSPPSNQRDIALQVGAPVDAWWSDGWWEGVITGVDNCGDDCLHVYFPSENMFLNVIKKDLRISRDWVGDKWVDIGAKLDILSAISAAFSPDTKNSTSSYQEVPTSSNLNIVEEKPKKAALASNDGLAEKMEPSMDEKPSLNEENTGDQMNDSQNRNNVDDDQNHFDYDDDNNINSKEEEDEEDDDVCDDDNNGGTLRMEFEAVVQKCDAVELMEVTA